MHLLFEVCSSPIWARRVLAGGPFRDVDALLDRADRVLAELPDAELDAALDGHPRIGAKVDNASSAREQARVRRRRRRRPRRTGRTATASTRTSSATSTWCAPAAAPPRNCWRSSPTGCDNDPETERRVMRSELAKINRLRLQRLLSEPADGAGSTRMSISTHVLDAVSGTPAAAVRRHPARRRRHAHVATRPHRRRRPHRRTGRRPGRRHLPPDASTPRRTSPPRTSRRSTPRS